MANIEITIESAFNATNTATNTITNTTASIASIECIICADTFNRSTRIKVVCENSSCLYECCASCVRTYLTTSESEPHCMQCKVRWTQKFLLILTKRWLNEEYKKHHSKLLCDIEISKIPETMEKANRYVIAEKLSNERDVLLDNHNTLRLEVENLYFKMRQINTTARQYMNRIHAIRNGLPDPINEGDTTYEKVVFFMQCPSNTCNGMLSTKYKCGICEKYTCPDCHALLDNNNRLVNVGNNAGNNAGNNQPHVCDPNDVASAAIIKKETRQCPECRVRIYRIEGCSQMWCVQCHAGFDWNTGKKINGERLHNPHWIEYQRSINNGVAMRAPEDVMCGGICSNTELRGIILALKKRYLYKPTGHCINNTHVKKVEETELVLTYLHALVRDISTNWLRETRHQCQTVRDFEEMRINYILGKITKEHFSAVIYRSDQKRQELTELIHVYELLSSVGIDLFNGILIGLNGTEDLMELIDKNLRNYNKLRIYCNMLLSVISNTYGHTVKQIFRGYNTIIGYKFSKKNMNYMIENENSEIGIEELNLIIETNKINRMDKKAKADGSNDNIIVVGSGGETDEEDYVSEVDFH